MDKPKTKKQPKPEETKADPGVWERFEHAVDAAVASGPMHRSLKPKKKTKGGGKRNRPKASQLA